MEKLYIVDASGYLYRSYHAIRQMTNAKGESTNALFGFVRSLLKLIKDFSPKYLVTVFDGPNNASKRVAFYPQYKANRLSMPKDLYYQILWAQEFCQLLGIAELMPPNVEADDTMGCITKWAELQQIETYLCTSDKDMCQLVNDRVFILNTFKENLIIDSKGVEEQFGVSPHQIVDYLSITGDASDNVPGLSGFGPKSAAMLLKQFGTLDYILDHPQDVAGLKKQETIIQEREQALLSRRLVTIDFEVEIPQQLDFYRIKQPQLTKLKEFYSSMNFSTLIRELDTHPLFKQSTEKSPSIITQETTYQLVDNEFALRELITLLSQQKQVCLDTETTNIHPLRAELVGIGLGYQPHQAWYIPFNGTLSEELLIEILKPFFENPNIGFYGHNLKYDYHVLLNYSIEIRTICFDTILASYLLNTHARQHSLDHLSLEIFDKIKIPIEELIGKGKQQINMKDVPIDQVCTYCCEDVDYTIRLKEHLEPELKERKLNELFYTLELPLLPILARMERRGIFIDTLYLQKLGQELNQEIEILAKAIYELSGEAFNLNSPKQLSQILFGKLGIIPPKKTANGFSTNAEVLESLKGKYPIAEKLLDYRSLEKLRSTYVETLPLQVNEKTHRIHCTFNQSGTATGRLSCQDPNLQNIPVRTEVGRKIREGFRPEKECWSYISADYSQIELRILAHLSEDPMLMEPFLANEDIHAFTASQIFNVPIDQVTKEQRYQSKTVNFGIMYGQQAFGLSQELKIDTKTAALFIKNYFEHYKKVKEFLEHCKELARETGKATTIFGRERKIPEIRSANAINRSMAERLAVNTPIQGTQADLIKKAMIEVEKKLREKNLKAYMILQIHDELIFEVPDEEIQEVSKLVREAMMGVHTLKVPLEVNISVGKNWKEC